MNKRPNKKGFTLIEVVITLLIVVLIASFGIGRYSSVQEESRVNIDIASARQLGDAAELALVNNPDLKGAALDTAIASRIKVPKPVSKTYKADKFEVSVDDKGVVTVSANSLELYPNVTKPTT